RRPLSSRTGGWPMVPSRTIRHLCSAATAWPRCRCAGLAAVVLLFSLGSGCETSKQERFRELNEDGIHLYERRDLAGAREHFEVALTLAPKDANVLYNLGHCNDRLGQAEVAESCYKQCLQSNANHPECRHALAVLLYRTGRGGQAEEMIQTWL